MMPAEFARKAPGDLLRAAVLAALRIQALERLYAPPRDGRRGKINYAPGLRTAAATVAQR